MTNLRLEFPAPARVTPQRRLPPTASVVICVFTERRWNDILAALTSVRSQHRRPEEIIVVVDHNDALLQRSRDFFTNVTVLANRGARGLSGARNTGVHVASGDVVVFLDDDARAHPQWLERLLIPYADPAVQGVGGLVVADWPTDRPGWFPPEFDWVVGCSYVGLPTSRHPIRNPIGAAMSVRRSAFAQAGGFTDGVGRVGDNTSGCDETEFFIRLRRKLPDASVVYEPRAIVDHRVTPERTSFAYFRRRCYAEGSSTALVARMVGSREALSTERRYVRRTLPRAVAGNLRKPGQWPRAGALMFGLVVTAAGYVRRRSIFSILDITA
ncbi:glycosyltransferase family 2 protein [Frankia sp. Cr2]|uniref:glycosyltransferase n=1 Tax=Frankia sp. Cr2 TaxID=3073932 RepID=UPI002AD3ADCC|nr:glycosyltransferase family 2 protein [Frankia sp. Cr2]